MENQMEKQTVSTERVLLEQSLEQPLDVEFVLPDYCPEIARILSCRVETTVLSPNCSGGAVNLDGNQQINLLYTDADGELYGYEYEQPFRRTVELTSLPEGPVVAMCQPVPDYVNCRALTPRKMEVHGACGLRLRVTGQEPVELLADTELPGMQLRTAEVQTCLPVTTVEKQFAIEETLPVPASDPAARAVLACDVRGTLSECKLLKDKLVVKGTLFISALVKTAEGAGTVEGEFPINQVVDAPGVTENSRCDARLLPPAVSVRMQAGADGEARFLLATGRGTIVITVTEEKPLTLITDAFSTRHETSVQRKDLTLRQLLAQPSERFVCKKTLEFPEDSVIQVLQAWCKPMGEVGQTEDGAVVLRGNLKVYLLARDAAGSYTWLERPLEYSYRKPLDALPDTVQVESCVSVGQTQVTMSGGNRAELQVELEIRLAVYQPHALSALADLTVDTEKPIPRPESTALVIYFAGAGEALWDIARRYHTSPAEIAAVNDMQGDTLEQERMLLIPSV